jgi:SAM-dependent methyltransferase
VKEFLFEAGVRAARIFGILSSLPFRFRSDRVKAPALVSRTAWLDYLAERYNKEGLRVLEIGSRNVTGQNVRSRFDKATYVGFDFYGGENVDVVGDAHKLSTYFQDGDKFDLIFSSNVFEHLHMPWVAAVEIQKMLKIGGVVFIETTFAFPTHERPWNFFQFSDFGLRALFNHSLGFDMLDNGMSDPISGHFSHTAGRDLRYRPLVEMYAFSAILCRKRCDVADFDWKHVDIDGVVDGTRYPAVTVLRGAPTSQQK